LKVSRAGSLQRGASSAEVGVVGSGSRNFQSLLVLDEPQLCLVGRGVHLRRRSSTVQASRPSFLPFWPGSVVQSLFASPSCRVKVKVK
jgi:hypothetical protein